MENLERKLELIKTVAVSETVKNSMPMAKFSIKKNILSINFGGVSKTFRLDTFTEPSLYNIEGLFFDICSSFDLLLSDENNSNYDDMRIISIENSLRTIEKDSIECIPTYYYYTEEQLNNFFDFSYQDFEEQVLEKAKDFFVVSQYKGKRFYITPKTICSQLYYFDCEYDEDNQEFREILKKIRTKKDVKEHLDINEDKKIFIVPNRKKNLGFKYKKALKELVDFINIENYKLNFLGAIEETCNRLLRYNPTMLFLNEDMLIDFKDQLVSEFVHEKTIIDKDREELNTFLSEYITKKYFKFLPETKSVVFCPIKEINIEVFTFKRLKFFQFGRFSIENIKDFNNRNDFVFYLKLDTPTLQDSYQENIYHFSLNSDIIQPIVEHSLDPRISMVNIMDILLRRERTKLNGFDYAIKPHLKEFFVDVKDSYNAGNCVIGTEQFMQKFGLKEQKEIRADKLFALDSSNAFVRRAIIAAYQKFKENEQSVY
ncbi:hypothetical protein CQA57_08010 [Helicobacter anseris]|uniref:Uncharacterized protein n=1 Tax=Helicobacter anseris TaxID=375926 RepID=A0A3D8J1P9_9HELI|nr:hypothetical protein [Helicobacter anseris]RDU71085.1 hypothetical protein CQA57_08010 [Helicobacter anseris]